MITKVLCMNQGDLCGEQSGVHVLGHRRAGRTGVRASIVAMKARNGAGAKGTQEGRNVKDKPQQEELATVFERTKQAREASSNPERWKWVETAVWTPRMLTALEKGVKGGKWFSLIDKVYAPLTLRRAYAQVWYNAGAAGVDHQTIEMFDANLDANLDNLSDTLKDESYRPAAVRRVWIPKPGSREERPLGIPCVRDRVVQSALRNVMEPIFESTFAEHSYGFRPGRGCKDALRRVDELLKADYHWVVDADLKSYFDTIPHGKLMELVAEQIADSRVLAVVEAFLQQGVMSELGEIEPEAGTPQGAVVSPLLANIYLNPLDHLMKQRGYEMVRYADDFVILCRTQAEAHAALAEVQRWTAQADLTLHPDKTRVTDANQHGGFDFLGYHFERGKKWPRKKSLKKLKDRLRAVTKRTNGRSLDETIKRVNSVLTGWYVYFKHSHHTTFPRLDSWIRMRLRSILRHRSGRKGRGRGKDHQRWPNAFFVARRLFTLSTAHELSCQSLKR